MNFHAMEKRADEYQARHPLAFKAAYPRNISVPKGYSDPRLYAAILLSHIQIVQRMGFSELAHKTGYGISISLVANRVPTYFVADEFARAVANTDIPRDFKFAELKWPMEALIFALSDEFCQSYFGHVGAPFLSVIHGKAGEYPGDFNRMPKMDMPMATLKWVRDWIMMDCAFFGAELPVTYNAAYPMTDGIDVFKTAPWNDATVFEYASRNMPPQKMKGELDAEAQEEFIQKAQQLIVKLLLAMAAMPAYREEGKVTRHAVVTQQGKVKLPEIVSPNLIGRIYKIPRKTGATILTTEGERAKPKFSYRRGHFAWTALRYKNAEFISVREMPRKPEGHIDFDAAGEDLSAKFRACHERQWIEGFFFDEINS